MDPASLTAAAVALLLSSFGTGFAQEAGQKTWEAIQNVGRFVRARLGRHNEQGNALAELEASPDDPVKQAAVTAYVRREIEADEDFAARLASLVEPYSRMRLAGP